MLPDPTLGIAVNFDAETFEAGTRFAMQMGLPNDPDRRPKFIRKSSARTYWKDGVQLGSTPRLDRDGNPFDADVEVRRGTDVVITTPKTAEPNTVDCAVEIQKADAEEIPVGNFRNTKAVITVLTADYPTISGCQELRYNGDRYQFGYEPEAPGMFGSGVNTLVFYAINES